MPWKKANTNYGKEPVPPRKLDGTSYKLYLNGKLNYSEWKSNAERQLEESKGNWSYSDYARLIQNERRQADWDHDITKTVLLTSGITVLLTVFASSFEDLSFVEMLLMLLFLGGTLVIICVCLFQVVFRLSTKRVFFYEDLLEIIGEKMEQSHIEESNSTVNAYINGSSKASASANINANVHISASAIANIQNSGNSVNVAASIDQNKLN